MASAAVLWFGESMSAVPLRNNKAAVSAVRAVTVLGATGSIGDSTMDLLRASRDRYQVEALTAHTNVQGLAPSNQVMINGLEVGTVYSITTDKNMKTIIVNMNLTRDVNIPTNSVALIKQSLLGTNTVDIRLGDATTYLGQPAVNYATAAGTYKQKIGIQKYLALYNRGFDAWTEQRRLDYPVLVAPPSAKSAYPVRYTYPIVEQNLNSGSYNKASTAIGGDLVITKLFWDKF